MFTIKYYSNLGGYSCFEAVNYHVKHDEFGHAHLYYSPPGNENSPVMKEQLLTKDASEYVYISNSVGKTIDHIQPLDVGIPWKQDDKLYVVDGKTITEISK